MDRNSKAPLSPNEPATLRCLRDDFKREISLRHRHLLLSMGLVVANDDELILTEAGHRRLITKSADNPIVRGSIPLEVQPPTADGWETAVGERVGGGIGTSRHPPLFSPEALRKDTAVMLTPNLTSGIQTAWPRRLQPLLDVLEELGCEPRAVLSKQLFPEAPRENLNLSAVVGRSTADFKPFLNNLSVAIHRRPNVNDLWRDVCGPLRFVKVPQGLVVVFERAIGTLAQTVH